MRSASRQISLEKADHDRWVATDEETGTTGVGESAGVALLGLGLKLGLLEGEARTLDELLDSLEAELRSEGSEEPSTDRLVVLAERVRERFERRGLTDADVEDAIRWARSP